MRGTKFQLPEYPESGSKAMSIEEEEEEERRTEVSVNKGLDQNQNIVIRDILYFETHPNGLPWV